MRVRSVARLDIDAGAGHLQDAAGTDVAHRFVLAVRDAIDHLARFPAAGSPRAAALLDVPGLRLWPVPGFRHVIAYVAVDGVVDVWRVLHERRDLPTHLGDDGPSSQ